MLLPSFAFVLLLSSAPPVAPMDHAAWDALLKRYVTAQSRVDYRGWSADGTTELDRYLAALALPWPEGIAASARKAALINAYNALTIRWVLRHYPLRSIWETEQPFSAVRHALDGKKTSLDGIESELRRMGDPRIHAALVCAARSCPPLRREAYTAGALDLQLDANTRAWLANEELNRFDAARQTAHVSMIFKWYAQDFEQPESSLRNFLARYAPPGRADFLRGGATIKHQTYVWGLNDTSSLGEDYSHLRFLWDYFRNR